MTFPEGTLDSWNTGTLSAEYRSPATGELLNGVVTVILPTRLTNLTDDSILPGGVVTTQQLSTSGDNSFSITLPATNDPNVEQTNWGYTVRVELEPTTSPQITETFSGVQVPIDAVVNLRTLFPNNSPLTGPVALNLDTFARVNSSGQVTDAEGNPLASAPTQSVDVSAKADLVAVDAALALKPDQVDVDAALALKADQVDVDAALALKADQTALEAVQASVTDALADKVSTAQLIDAVAPKANAAAVEQALALKADNTSLEAAQAAMTASINTKVGQAAVDAAVAPKANKTYVDSLVANTPPVLTLPVSTPTDTWCPTAASGPAGNYVWGIGGPNQFDPDAGDYVGFITAIEVDSTTTFNAVGFRQTTTLSNPVYIQLALYNKAGDLVTVLPESTSISGGAKDLIMTINPTLTLQPGIYFIVGQKKLGSGSGTPTLAGLTQPKFNANGNTVTTHGTMRYDRVTTGFPLNKLSNYTWSTASTYSAAIPRITLRKVAI